MIRRLALILPALALSACVAAPAPSTAPAAPETAPVTSTTTSIAPSSTLPPPTEPPTTTPRVRPATPLDTDRQVIDVTADTTAEVFYPVDAGVYPTVVFFHGGSWYGGELASTSEFARTVAGQGAVVFNATYRNGQQGGGFPHSYEDVRCAIVAAATTGPDFGGTDTVVVAGHSAGAHLAATVAMSADTFASSRCSIGGPGVVAGFVGIAGPYDTVLLGAFMAPWFGGAPTDVPDAWERGNPQAYLAEPRFPVTLLHGSGDRLVDLDSSIVFDALLRANGWVSELYVIPAATHNGVLDPFGDGREAAAAIAQFAEAVTAG